MTLEIGLAIIVKSVEYYGNYGQQITIKTIFMLIFIMQPFPSC